MTEIETDKKQEEKKVYYGTVCWFKQTYGFISFDIDGVPQKDIFVHYTGVASEGFKTLYKHQKVSFEIGENMHGQPKAVNVIVLRN